MLTFFRRIRKGLLGDGATSKYLLYAIGEIALVVIGILIALQINNWNSQKLDNKLESEYLGRLQSDLQFDLETLNWSLPYVGEKKEALKRALQLIKTDTLIHSDTLTQILDVSTRLSISIRINRQNATYSELVSTGNLNLIRNYHLRNRITEYYTLWDNNILRVDKSNTGYRNIVSQISDPDNLFEQRAKLQSLNDLLDEYGLIDQYRKLLNEEATYSVFVERRLTELSVAANELLDRIFEEEAR